MPPRSPDLTPLDFFLWGHLQSIVYEEGPPATLRDLRDRITRAFGQVRRTRMVRNAVATMRRRAATCIRLRGQQVEGRAAQ